MGWRIKDKITVDPSAEDLLLLEQNGNSRSTTFGRIKNWLLGTDELTTTDKTANGAINEINKKVGSIDVENDGDVAKQLNAIANVAINVKSFGAKGDGVTDDTLSVLNAIATGKTIFFPEGTYKITQILNCNVNILGAGKEKTKILFSEVSGFSVRNNDFWTIKDLSLITDVATKTSINLAYCNYAVIDNVTIKGVDSNSYWSIAIKTQGCWNGIISKVDIVGGEEHVHQRGVGVYVDYSVNMKMNNCNLTALNYGITFSEESCPEGDNPYISEGWTITSNLIIASNYGIQVNSGRWIDISHNIIDMAYKIGVYLKIQGAGSVSDNWIAQYNFDSSNTDNTYVGIYVETGARLGINNNSIIGKAICDSLIVFKGSQLAFNGNNIYLCKVGITLYGNNNIIDDNQFNECSLYAAKILSDYNIVKDNMFFSNVYADSSKTNNIIKDNLPIVS